MNLKDCPWLYLLHILHPAGSHSTGVSPKSLPSLPTGGHYKSALWKSFKKHADMKDTDIIAIFNVKEKKNLIWISFLLEMDVYFQNIALAASAEAIYRPQRGS